MFNMEILSIFLLTFTLTAAQYRPRSPALRNPGFRNVHTPLDTSAARNRPFISIPIVLLPDGQSLPKPKHATYHYVGHATQNGPRANNHRNNKPRGPMAGKPTVNYQVAIPSQVSSFQQKKIVKPPKLTATQLNGHLRNAPNLPKHRGHGQNPQQNQNQAQKPPQASEQTQQIHQIQFVKQQQRNPQFQQQTQQQSQQAAANHKQNVANFVNFATNIGAAIMSQQQNQPVILPTQAPGAGVTFQNQANHKSQESIMSQKSLLSNHKLSNGVLFQHQVPSQQVHFPQPLPNNLANHNNGYNTHHQQQHTQQTQSSPQPQQQQEQTQTSPAPEGQYLPASNLRSNSQSSQGSELQNNVQYSSNQPNVFQQNGATNLRSQNGQNSVVLLNHFNSQVQQNNQQSYATSSAPQQPTPAPHVVANYDSQTHLPKTALSVQQATGTTGYALNPQTAQNSYASHNQATQQQNYNLETQGQQVSFSNNAQTSSISYPTADVAQTNLFSLQNSQTSGAQLSDPLSYFHYQTSQELPLSYASLFNQGQTSYISPTQNVQQNDPTVEQSYTILPSSQSVFGSSSIPTIFVSSQQDESSSSSSPSEGGVQTYESYSNDQSSYPTSTSQANQASYISTSNAEKGYPVSQYSYVQSSADSQTNPSSETQLSQSSSSDDSGHLVYASSSSKQITFPQSQSSYPSSSQQYSSSNYQSSPTYISFQTAGSNYKSEAQTPLTYAQRTPGVVTPGSTYAKASQNSAKQTEASETAEDSEQDSEFDDEEESEEEEASYKVVYIPLDILKNILSNSVENQ